MAAVAVPWQGWPKTQHGIQKLLSSRQDCTSGHHVYQNQGQHLVQLGNSITEAQNC